MDYEYEYKQQIEPYKWLLVKRIDDLQYLLRMKNRLLSENGLSYLPLLADDLYNAAMNVYDVLPKSVEVDEIGSVRELHSKLIGIRYEEMVNDDYRAGVLSMLNKYVEVIHLFVNKLIVKLDELGLLFRRDKIPTGGER